MGARISRINRGRNAGFLLVKAAIKNSKNIGKDVELKILVKATPHPLAFGLTYGGRYWSAKIDDISL